MQKEDIMVENTKAVSKKWIKGYCLLIIALLLITQTTLFAQGPDTLWTKKYGGSDHDYGFSVQQTFDGGYIVAGRTESPPVSGPSDVYLVKTDANGNLQWDRKRDIANNDDWSYSVLQTPDTGYVIAGRTYIIGSSYDVFLMKTDTSGFELWNETYGGAGIDRGYSVDQTFDGGYIIAGWTESFGNARQVYLIKTNAYGESLWTKTYGGAGNDEAYSVQQTSDNGFIIVGYTNSPPAVNYDVYLIKTDSIGDTLWTKTYGGSANDYGYSVKQTAGGGYIITGWTNSFGNGIDVYIVKTDGDGNFQLDKNYGGTGDDYGRSISPVSDGGYIILGHTNSYGNNWEFYLVKTNAYGTRLWQKVIGWGYDEYGYSIQQTSDGGYILAGHSNSFSSGLLDVQLIKIAIDTFGIEENQITSLPLTELDVFPNPFSDRIDIKYSIGHSAKRVELNIYDVTGRIVKQFDYKTIRLSDHVSWDGRDNAGKKVAGGVYFLQFEMGDNKATKKLLLIK